MGYLLIYFIIIIYATTLTIILKKKIEEVMPIGIVAIILIIFLSGLLDNLQIGIIVIEALTVVQVIFILIMLIKNSKEVAFRILTPGLAVYSILFLLNILINKNRILENYDEFNHWAVAAKNLFMFHSFTDEESVVRFNEYPPFTAIFQYLFLAFQKAYSEDTLIIAQNVLYFSIVIPITKCIKWDKSLLKLLVILPTIIFLPMIFYENFYLEILVDGMIGVMFAYVMLSAFESEEQTKFKYLKILAGEIMLVLTKMSSIPLALLALIIMLIEKIAIGLKQDKTNAKKEIKAIILVFIIILLITSIWYCKVSKTEKRWDLEQIVKVDTQKIEKVNQITTNFIQMIFWGQEITAQKFTAFSVIMVLICLQLYQLKRDKKSKYYYIAMMVSILIWLIGLLITYATIFSEPEAMALTCFGRYVSTILLANAMFLAFTIIQEKQSFKKYAILVSILVLMLPLTTIKEKYLNPNYIIVSHNNRNSDTKLKDYTSQLKTTDKLLYVVGGKRTDLPYITAMNNYEIMPIKITKTIKSDFKNVEDFKNTIKDYTHVFFYQMTSIEKEKIQSAFEEQKVKTNVIYKVENENGQITLKIER